MQNPLAITRGRKRARRHLLRPGFWIVSLAGLAASLGCSSGRLRYQPDELTAFRRRPAVRELPFETDKGRQVAYYLAPTAGSQSRPDPLIIGFPGIGTRALDWLPMIDDIRAPRAGYLLLDYPGRGQCEGMLRPKDLPQTYEGALQALARASGSDLADLTSNLYVLGHSFGTAAGLLFAQDHDVRRIVLLAPLTTVRQALFRKVGPLAWLNPDNLDNRKQIQQLLRRTPAPYIAMIHGIDDDSLPLGMAWELQALAPDTIILHEIPGGTHVSILRDCRALIRKLLMDPLPPAPIKSKE